MQNQMMAMNSVANLSSADRRDATFLNTCKKICMHQSESKTNMLSVYNKPIRHIATMQCSVGKPLVLQSMWMPHATQHQTY